MLIAYVDESGDSGARGSMTYCLGCVLVDSSRWLASFDTLIQYRRFLRRQFGVPFRSEIKANYLLRNGGSLRTAPLSEPARFAIYRGFMRVQMAMNTRAFAIVIRKAELAARGAPMDPVDTAWTYLLQRLERATATESTEAIIMHDEGDAARVKHITRRFRRIGTAGSRFGGSLRRPGERILDDPVPRVSTESFFLQLADMNAYAAFRRIYPPPPAPGRRTVVPVTMWDELGTARFAAVNSLRGGPPGIVAWP